MAIKDIFKISRKTFFNPRAWLGYDELKSSTKIIAGLAKEAFTPAKPIRQETFEQAMVRLKISEADLASTKQSYFLYACGFALIGICIFIASIYYLFHHHSLSGFILGLAVTVFAFAQAFRFHFWYFEIKHRKLGCTFDEWRRGKPDSASGQTP